MDGVYIAWTPENWITILLMVALGYGLFALGVTLLKRYSGQ